MDDVPPASWGRAGHKEAQLHRLSLKNLPSRGRGANGEVLATHLSQGVEQGGDGGLAGVWSHVQKGVGPGVD